jgi:transcription termination/antitermination protein NusG
MAKQWYVVHTFTGHEDKVKVSIERRAASLGLGERVGRILVPTEEELRGTRRGRRQVSKHKVFPGYVIVEMELDDQTRYLIRATTGVTGFVGPDRQPVALSPEEVERLLSAVSEETAPVRAAWNVGETVRITSEPFDGIHGKIVDVDVKREKLKVLVSIFGRETPVEVDFADVEKLD